MGDVHIMLMENTLRLENKENLRYVFDLKGSQVDRRVTGKTKPSTTLKDENFYFVKRELKGLTSLKRSHKRLVIDAIKNDVEFLKSKGLMDYSLLLGIEKLTDK